MHTGAAPLNVFVGTDPREEEAYRVCRFSLLRRASVPVAVHPLRLKALRHERLIDRPFEVREGQKYDLRDGKPLSTEFTYTRFLIPHLMRHRGWALFCDCDFLWLGDVKELFDLADERYAVMVVKHEYIPRETHKMDGQKQTAYPRKNWSSLVLWNCAHPQNRTLSIHRINWKPGRWLHGFRWLSRVRYIGEVPQTWNWLSGVSEALPDNEAPKAIHYTLGGPWFDNCQDVPHADLWLKEQEVMWSQQAAPRAANQTPGFEARPPTNQ